MPKSVGEALELSLKCIDHIFVSKSQYLVGVAGIEPATNRL